MSEAYKQVLLGEDNMDLMKKAAGGAMQHIKLKDGKLKMDSFTASAIMGVYDKVNPANKKKIETIINRGNKTSILKLQSMAMKAIKSGDELEHDGEELDEAKNYKIKNGKIHISKANFRKVHKDYKNSTKGKERMMALDPKSGATTSYEVVFEEVELDEKKIVLAKGMGKEVINDNGVIKLMKGGKVISDGDYDSGAGKFFMNIKGERGQVAFNEPEELLKIKEEVELDEKAKYTRKLMKNKSIVDYVKKQQEKNRKKVAKFGNKKVFSYSPETRFDPGTGWGDLAADAVGLSSMSLDKRKAFDWDGEYEAIARKLGLDKFEPKLEEVELEEGKMKELHMLIKQGKSAEEIAKIMKVDAKTIKALMSAYIADDDKYPEMLAAACKGGGGGPSGGTEYMSYTPSGDMTEGARADAMRAMRRSKEVDPADVDITATDDDVKAASKNIMMQMRKVISLRGNFKVEFGDKKKMKIDPRIAQAVMSKYDSMRKPAEKEKFQAKVAKSYKDMLSALKESLDEGKMKELSMKIDDVVAKMKKDRQMKGFADKFKKDVMKSMDIEKSLEKVLPDYVAGKDIQALVKEEDEVDEKKKQPVFKGTPAQIKKQMKDWKKKHDKVKIGEDMTVTGAVDGGISQRDLDYVQKELRKLGIKDAVVDQNEMDSKKMDIKTKMSNDKVKKAFDKSKMTVTYEHVQMEGTWHTPETPKEKAGLKKLLKKPVIFGKDGDDAIDAISDYIGDDGLYDDLYDNGKKNSKGDARPVIKAAMKRLGIKEEKETILDRIDKKIQERKNG